MGGKQDLTDLKMKIYEATGKIIDHEVVERKMRRYGHVRRITPDKWPEKVRHCNPPSKGEEEDQQVRGKRLQGEA